MRNSSEIAKAFTKGEKVKTSDARQLASGYLEAVATINQLRRENLSLSGGERAQVKFGSFQRRDWQVWPFKRRNGMHSSGGKNNSLINELLKKLGSITVHHGITQYIVNGGKIHLDTFLELNPLITEAIQNAYDVGFEEGSNILQRLASGEASITEFDAVTKKAA